MKVEVKQEKIKELRLSNGWTQEQLAEISGVHARTVQRIESDGFASIQSLKALALALNVELTMLQLKEAETQSNDQPISSDEYMQPSNKLNEISFKERQEIKHFAKEAERLETWQNYGWAGWVLLFIGGILTVIVLLMTEANLNRTVIFNVFFPGITIGQLLMLIGAFGIHLGKKAATEKRILGKLRFTRPLTPIS